ncbi:sporulation membrane protein YtaF [Paenibacillus sp. GP183]|uniref:sporulation membrane protein YtaF n=1 Tax=Paenibacillus sp. GP183 TaxID=1882751 RepID=UPI00089D9C84|nr:sporulation membrane protein YtaF [Paenibacillus sp. GP183]SEC44568.1 putative sporulation protein YtaF [Paenibacillus sp. GP183]
MYWLTILALALSSSIDNFGVGISYGIRGIRVGLLSNLIISLIAFIFSETGILFGQYLTKIMPGVLSTLIGAIFLLVIGFRIILLTLPKKRVPIPDDFNKPKSQSHSNITEYLTTPEKADIDNSGHIGSFEAIALGIAVSMNALTNGLGAGLIGLSPFAISTSAAIFSFLAIWWGVALGRKVSTVRIGSLSMGQFSTVLSGVILLLIAIKSLM